MGGLFRIDGNTVEATEFRGDAWEDQAIQTPGSCGMGELRYFNREMGELTSTAPPMFGDAPLGGHRLDAGRPPRERTWYTYTNPATGESWRICFNPATGRWESPEGIPLAALAARR